MRILGVSVVMTGALLAQGQGDRDWPMFNRDLAGTRYSPLTQVDTTNVTNAGAPTIYRNLLFVGTNFYGPGDRHVNPALDQASGQIPEQHAYDVRTGKELWSFHTFPHEGEPGNETWAKGTWANRTGNNVWAFALTVDEARGILYIPVS